MGQKRAFEVHEAYSGIMDDVDSEGLLKDLRNMVDFTLIKDTADDHAACFAVQRINIESRG